MASEQGERKCNYKFKNQNIPLPFGDLPSKGEKVIFKECHLGVSSQLLNISPHYFSEHKTVGL